MGLLTSLREPPPFSLQLGTMVGFMVFYMRDNLRTVAIAARRLQGVDSIDSKDDVEQAILVEAGNVSVLFSAIFFFFVGVWIVAGALQADLHIVQRSVLKKRVEYSMYVCLYVCFFSCLFNVMQFGPQDDVVLDHVDARDEVILDIGRPIEWILTCPLMQLVLPIIGGEKVPDYRRWTMPLNAFVVLSFGLAASLQTQLPIKLGFYFSGVMCFCVMLNQMNRCIVDASDGQENMCVGKSFMKNLTVIVAATWIPFPIWYALSPEGFNIIKNAAGMKISVAFLNVFSKGAFIFYINRVRAELDVREKAIAQARLKAEGADIEEGKEDMGLLGQPSVLNKNTAEIIRDVLKSMGREADFDAVKAVLEAHMITSSDDILVLTATYCQSITLPWGFVSACKQRIRAQKVEMQDAWTLKTDKAPPMMSRSANVSRAPSESGRYSDEPMSPTGRDGPLPPQVAADPRKMREHARRELSRIGRDPDEYDEFMGNNEAKELARQKKLEQERAEMQAMLQQSEMALAKEIRELRLESAERARQAAEMEQKVEEDLHNAQEVVGDMMEKVMDVLERRLQQFSARNESRREILGSKDEEGGANMM
jgi:bacteriorhodopsin